MKTFMISCDCKTLKEGFCTCLRRKEKREPANK